MSWYILPFFVICWAWDLRLWWKLHFIFEKKVFLARRNLINIMLAKNKEIFLINAPAEAKSRFGIPDIWDECLHRMQKLKGYLIITTNTNQTRRVENEKRNVLQAGVTGGAMAGTTLADGGHRCVCKRGKKILREITEESE